MYTLAYSLPVNPSGTDIVLTREGIWGGLVMKAENALPFVPAMQECEIVERFDGGFKRRVLVNDETWFERITLTPQIQVLFERTDAGGVPAGWIANVLSESDDGLWLTFVLNVVVPGASDASAERRHGDLMKAQYIGAIAATLKKTRELSAEAAR